MPNYKHRKASSSEVFNCSNCGECLGISYAMAFDSGDHAICTKCVKEGNARSKGTAWRALEELLQRARDARALARAS